MSRHPTDPNRPTKSEPQRVYPCLSLTVPDLGKFPYWPDQWGLSEIWMSQTRGLEKVCRTCVIWLVERAVEPWDCQPSFSTVRSSPDVELEDPRRPFTVKTVNVSFLGLRYCLFFPFTSRVVGIIYTEGGFLRVPGGSKFPHLCIWMENWSSPFQF